jgi:hypothetical protein
VAWIDAKARFKIVVSDLLFPDQAVVADNAFKLTWAIPRIQTNPVSLKSEADYNQLIKKALQAKNPAARILVDEVENDLVQNLIRLTIQSIDLTVLRTAIKRIALPCLHRILQPETTVRYQRKRKARFFITSSTFLM